MNPVTARSTVKEVYDLAKDAKEDYNCIIKWIIGNSENQYEYL